MSLRCSEVSWRKVNRSKKTPTIVPNNFQTTSTGDMRKGSHNPQSRSGNSKYCQGWGFCAPHRLCCPVPSVSSRPHSQLEAFFEPIQFHLQSGRSLDKASRLRYLESLDAPSGSSVDPAWHGVSA